MGTGRQEVVDGGGTQLGVWDVEEEEVVGKDGWLGGMSVLDGTEGTAGWWVDRLEDGRWVGKACMVGTGKWLVVVVEEERK